MLLTRNNSGLHSKQPSALDTSPQQQQQQLGRQYQPQEGTLVVGIHHYSGSWMDWDLKARQQQQQQFDEEVSSSSRTFGAVLLQLFYYRRHFPMQRQAPVT